MEVGGQYVHALPQHKASRAVALRADLAGESFWAVTNAVF